MKYCTQVVAGINYFIKVSSISVPVTSIIYRVARVLGNMVKYEMGIWDVFSIV